MEAIEDDKLFDDIEAADLELHGEDVPEKELSLRQYDDDHGDELYEPAERIDISENRSRGTDFEATPGRVRTGKDGELDLGRVDVDSEGRAHGGESGADWQSNMSTRKGMVACDGTGFVSDRRISAGQTNRAEGVDEELHQEMRDAGLRLGINSLNINEVGFALEQSRWMANQKRYWSMSPWEREALNTGKRERRANRGIEQVREDSIHNKYREHYNVYVDDREAEDPLFWEYGDPEEKDRLDGIDQRSARQKALTWRHKYDERQLQAFVVRYMAFLEGIKPDSIRARFKRKPHQRDLAGFVFATDAMACGVVMPGGFDVEHLLDQAGDELALKMETPRSDLERREFIIKGAHKFYSEGSLFPPYVYAELEETLEAVIEVLLAAGVDMSPPEPEIDWSKV